MGVSSKEKPVFNAAESGDQVEHESFWPNDEGATG